MNCRSPLAYTDVGKGREQDAEALRANFNHQSYRLK